MYIERKKRKDPRYQVEENLKRQKRKEKCKKYRLLNGVFLHERVLVFIICIPPTIRGEVALRPWNSLRNFAEATTVRRALQLPSLFARFGKTKRDALQVLTTRGVYLYLLTHETESNFHRSGRVARINSRLLRGGINM